MKSAIHVGNNLDKAAKENIKDLIETIFRAGFETHMDQKTIRCALDLVSEAATIGNINITGCTIESNDTITSEDKPNATGEDKRG